MKIIKKYQTPVIKEAPIGTNNEGTKLKILSAIPESSIEQLTRRKHRQRPAAKSIGSICNGNPWPIKFSMAMLKISIAQQQQQQQQQQQEGHHDTKNPNAAGNLTSSQQQQQQQQLSAFVDLRCRCR